MCQLDHETEQQRYCLLDPLMTLCQDHLVHFLIYDKLLDMAERRMLEADFKASFTCRPDIALSPDLLEKMSVARDLFLSNYGLFFNVKRGLPRDTKAPEKDAKGTMTEDKVLERSSLWDVRLGMLDNIIYC